MKGAVTAAVAAMAGVASAHNHRHAHDLFKRMATGTGDVCVPGCTTIWKTVTGEMTLVPTTTITATHTSTEFLTVTPTSTVVPITTTVVPVTTQVPTTTEVVVVPTPHPQTCPTPGTYTFPATTITVKETTTVCGATSTSVPPGTHTVGGVTTVVTTSTVVTCPVATIHTTGGVTTSTIVQTTYVCPSAGTYTIAPHTTTVTESCVIQYPTPTTIVPGTYTAPAKVVTATVTDYVVYCPFTSVGLPTAAPSSAPQTQPEPKPQPKHQPKPQSQPKPQPQSKPHGSIGGDSDRWGITYTPYQPSNGDCKTAEAIAQDVLELKNAGFKVLRVYSTDCNTLEYVGNACEKYGLKMIIGLFVKNTGCEVTTPDIQKQIDQISSWAKWDMVELFVMGNESIMNGFCTAEQLVTLIKTVKAACPGYKGPYTISETLNIWQTPGVASTICPVVDITGANVHAFFNPNVVPSGAGDFVASQLEILSKICPGKQSINLESGWPTKGKCNGQACPGESEQAEALKKIREKCGRNTVFFSYEDDLWKPEGDCQCEKSWGSKAAFAI